MFDKKCEYFIDKEWCVKLYAQIDLELMIDFHVQSVNFETFLPVDEEMLLANIKGITLISSHFALHER